jgi:phosphoribosylamine--glycine ligase
MNICIIGSGGREAALSWKISQSPGCNQLYIAPGNGGTAVFGKNVDLDINNIPVFSEWLKAKNIQLLIIGPEAPLVEGIYDDLKNVAALKDLMIIGPSKMGAALEGSKSFAKAFMKEFKIPTASFLKFHRSELDTAIQSLDKFNPPYVLKADGLAAGKGVLIIDDKKAAAEELRNMLSGKFGTASETVVIEEFLEGIEFSVFVITDGKNYQILPEAKDYKRRHEGDTGLNTGGMGAVSPVPFVDEALMDKVVKRIIEPTIQGIQSRNMDYKGFIFFGLINVDGDPFVIEYNCRMGDPETEVVIPRVQNDLVELLKAVYHGTLSEKQLVIDKRTAATIMLVSDGYPGSYEKGKLISGIETVSDSIVFHAGTKNVAGSLVTNGGRVIAVTSLGENKDDALAFSKSSIAKIDFEGMRYRSDIGFDL